MHLLGSVFSHRFGALLSIYMGTTHVIIKKRSPGATVWLNYVFMFVYILFKIQVCQSLAAQTLHVSRIRSLLGLVFIGFVDSKKNIK